MITIFYKNILTTKKEVCVVLIMQKQVNIGFLSLWVYAHLLWRVRMDQVRSGYSSVVSAFLQYSNTRP